MSSVSLGLQAAADPADDQAGDQAVQPIMSGFIEWLCNQLRCVPCPLACWAQGACAESGAGAGAGCNGVPAWLAGSFAWCSSSAACAWMSGIGLAPRVLQFVAGACCGLC